jgi:protein-tyrosine-phosphatase
MSDDLRGALARSSRVLFVCSGNMIRSAFADLYARHLRLPRPVASCGTLYFNDRIHPRARAALVARGVSLERIQPFRPTHLSELVRPEGGARDAAGTLALGMTRDHVDVLGALPELAGRSFLLGEARGGGEISDPLFDGGYEECFDELARCVEALVAALRDQRAP